MFTKRLLPKSVSYTHLYAQLHAKGEFEENGHKVHSLIGISIQDYSSGTGDKNIITRFHLAPEQIQFLLSRVCLLYTSRCV